MRSLCIIMPNYNGAKLFDQFLPSVLIACQNYPYSKEIIIVDDASKDGSIEKLREFSQNIRIVERPVNGGFSAACNTGASETQAEILFFLNTDVELSENFFDFFNSYFDHPDTFAVTVKGFQYRTGKKLDGVKVQHWKRGNLRVTQNYYPEEDPACSPPYESASVQGAYFFVDRVKFEELGGFDELFSPYIFEETDLSYRAINRGWKIYYEPRCVARHDHSSTLGSVAKKKRLQFISQRNRLIFTWKNIQEPHLLLSHALFLFLRLLIVTPQLWQAFNAAVRMWPQIRKKREVETAARARLLARRIVKS